MNLLHTLASQARSARRTDERKSIAALRERARAALDRSGLPTRRDEPWRFTPLRRLESISAPTTAASVLPADQTQTVLNWVTSHLTSEVAQPATSDTPETVRVVLLNGQPVGPYKHAAVRVEHLAKGNGTDSLTEEGLASEQHFSALNGALFESGALIQLDAAKPIVLELVHVSTSASDSRGTSNGKEATTAERATITSFPRCVLLIEGSSDVTLVETFLELGNQPHLTIPVTELHVGSGARVEHVRCVVGEDTKSETSASFHIGTLGVQLGHGAEYTCRPFGLGGAVNRLEIDVHLASEKARCNVLSVYIANANQHVAQHTRMRHKAGRTESHDRSRALVAGNGQAVFDGIIYVQQDAQGCEAHQESRNLLLSDEAVVHTKPQLEIAADDIRCSHGATVGSLDEEQLFYLRARGIGQTEATTMLSEAFVRERIETVTHAPTRAWLLAEVQRRLPGAAEDDLKGNS